jgi:hypothetical protein
MKTIYHIAEKEKHCGHVGPILECGWNKGSVICYFECKPNRGSSNEKYGKVIGPGFHTALTLIEIVNGLLISFFSTHDWCR